MGQTTWWKRRKGRAIGLEAEIHLLGAKTIGGVQRIVRALGAVTLACVAVAMLVGGGALGPVMCAFLLLNAFLLLGTLVWT